jgi:hypothetical protein
MLRTSRRCSRYLKNQMTQYRFIELNGFPKLLRNIAISIFPYRKKIWIIFLILFVILTSIIISSKNNINSNEMSTFAAFLGVSTLLIADLLLIQSNFYPLCFSAPSTRMVKLPPLISSTDFARSLQAVANGVRVDDQLMASFQRTLSAANAGEASRARPTHADAIRNVNFIATSFG